MNKKKPNVVLIFCDQLRPFELGCYGHEVVETPNIDRLAAEGVLFEQAFTNNPVCTPARSSVISGQYSRTCTGEIGNVADDPPTKRRRRIKDATIAEVLKGQGYRTALVGKWHIDPDPNIVGFDEAIYPLSVHRYQGQRFFHQDKLQKPYEGFSPEHELEVADRLIGEWKEDPFFMYYNISLPHEPIGPQEMPKKYIEKYHKDQVLLRDNVFVDGKMAHDEKWFKIYQIWDYFWRLWGPCWNADPELGYPTTRGDLPSDALPEGFDLRDMSALYYGAIHCVDDLVGKFMSLLQKHGLTEDTIVVFSSDHGENMGSHHLFNKDCLYEESVRIPMIYHAPGRITPRREPDKLVQIIDFMPTVLGLLDVEVPEHVQGRDMSAVVRGEGSEVKENAVFIETDPSQFGFPCIGIRTPEYLYGCEFDVKKWQIVKPWALFDIKSDPLQMNNLVESDEHLKVCEDLHAKLSAWNERTPALKVEG